MKKQKTLILTLFFFHNIFLFSQKDTHTSNVFMKIKDYKEKFDKKKLTKKDSLNIKIINNDTLIKVEKLQKNLMALV